MYRVRFVNDEDMPTEWAFVRSDGRLRLYLRESAVCPAILEQAWAAYRNLAGGSDVEVRVPPCDLPRQVTRQLEARSVP